MKKKEYILETVIYILSLPLIIFFFLKNLWEEAVEYAFDYQDQAYMKRINILDQKHFDDFIKWNREYIEERESGNKDNKES